MGPVLGTAGSAYVLLTLGACTTTEAGEVDVCASCGATVDCGKTTPDSLVGTETCSGAVIDACGNAAQPQRLACFTTSSV